MRLVSRLAARGWHASRGSRHSTDVSRLLVGAGAERCAVGIDAPRAEQTEGPACVGEADERLASTVGLGAAWSCECYACQAVDPNSETIEAFDWLSFDMTLCELEVPSLILTAVTEFDWFGLLDRRCSGRAATCRCSSRAGRRHDGEVGVALARWTHDARCGRRD